MLAFQISASLLKSSLYGGSENTIAYFSERLSGSSFKYSTYDKDFHALGYIIET